MTLARLHRPEFWVTTPFAHLNTLRDEINRLFEAPFGDLERGGEFFNGWAPALDLREDKENLVATIELPGMKKEDIAVTVHEGILSISGERTAPEGADDAGNYRSERFYGRFHRTISLPKPVHVEGIRASYKDGVLSVTLPKTEEARPRQIEVKVS